MESKTEYQINDSELVLYVRENNEDAKEELFNRYLPLLYKEIRRHKKRAQVLGIEEADLSQEAMLAFSHAINSYNEDEDVKFITFATLCIRRKLANFVEKHDTRKSKALEKSIPLDAIIDENTSYLDQLEDFHVIDPLRQIINTETLDEAMIKMSSNLSENELAVLKYDLDGLSINEIAKVLDKTPKQIYNLIHRARNKVKPKS